MSKGSRWSSSYAVMAIVIVMYAVKVASKLAIGAHIHSPMITGDGFHNAADIVMAVLVVVSVFISKLPANEHYPFGRKNVESIVRLAIGAMLIPTAAHFGATSLMGLLSYAPSVDQAVRSFVPFDLPKHQPLLMGQEVNVLWILGVTGGSVLLSVVVGRFEVAAGKANGQPSMIADGKETLSDGLIELVIFLGVCGEHLFRAAWLEYPLGLGVAFLVARTGKELWIEGWHALLQRSLGRQVESDIWDACLKLRGLRQLQKLTTFRIGSRAVIILRIVTDAPAAAHDDLEQALRRHVAAKLARHEIEEMEFHLTFAAPETVETRVAYAAAADGPTIVVDSEIMTATHFIIATLHGSQVVRWTLEQPPTNRLTGLLDWLEDKRVTKLCLFGDRPAERVGKIMVVGVPSYDLRILGLEDLKSA